MPELPRDEAKCDLPMREMLAQHRANPVAPRAMRASIRSGWRSKATARSATRAPRIWPAGPSTPWRLSRRQSRARASRACETYIREHRQNDYLENLSRKLLAYALIAPCSSPTSRWSSTCSRSWRANGYRFATLIETIVTSPQFLNRRNPDPRERTVATKER